MTSPETTTPPARRSRLPFLMFLGGGSLAYAFLIRPLLLQWGTLPGEAESAMPGDDIIMHPSLTLTHAIDIHAPAEVVWLWLSQMGRDHVGFYALDAINNYGVRSATTLRPNLPKVAPGMRLDNGLQVFQADAPLALVIGGFNQTSLWGHTYDITYAYQLQRVGQHSHLTARVRLYAYGLQGLVYPWLMEPFYALQSVLQLTTVAALAPRSKEQVTLSKEKSNGHQPLKI